MKYQPITNLDMRKMCKVNGNGPMWQVLADLAHAETCLAEREKRIEFLEHRLLEIVHYNYDRALTRICSNCEYPEGDHRVETNHCPVALPPLKFRDTVFSAKEHP